MTDKPMTFIELTEVEGGLPRALEMMRSIIEFADANTIFDLRVGIDPIDHGLKFSVNRATWTPPARGIISPPTTRLPRPRR
jgi:hypothetical protein